MDSPSALIAAVKDFRTSPPGLPRILVGVIVVCAVAAVAAPLWPALRVTTWSALMLASFVGWGTLVNRWIVPDRRVDWGLRAGWGMALCLLLGGFLCLAHLAVRVTFIAQVSLGLVALLMSLRPLDVGASSRCSARVRTLVAIGPRSMFATTFVAYATAAFTFFAFLGNHTFQPSDDPPFYFMLAEKLVQIGSLFEPFAGRRVTVLGGQIYLDALFASVASIYYLHVVDAGLCLVIVVALLVGHVRQRGADTTRTVALAFAVLILFTLRDVRQNTTSQGSGLVALLTLFRTVRLPLEDAEEAKPAWPMDPRRIIALSALALTGTLLRVSNGPAAILFVAFMFCSDWADGAPRPWTVASFVSLLRAGALFAGTFLVGLLPWCLLERQSTGTLFYPLGHSNLTPGWTLGLEAASNWRQELTELALNLFYGRPLAAFVPFAIAALVPLAGRRHRDVMAFSLASLVGLAIFSHNAAAFGIFHVARYCAAFVSTTALVVVLSVDEMRMRSALVAGAVAIHVVSSMPETIRTFHGYFRNVRQAFRGDDDFAAVTRDYVDVQSHIPPRATIATAVLEGFRFDFRRNPIVTLDILGGMGPKPGWPARRGPHALGDYLAASGLQYLVWADFSLPNEFYNRDHWISHLAKTGSYLQPQAVLQLDAEDSIEKLSAMRRVVYQAHGMTVVDLTAAR
jgi:hypothetical protein